jgi:hypothetical protein
MGQTHVVRACVCIGFVDVTLSHFRSACVASACRFLFGACLISSRYKNTGASMAGYVLCLCLPRFDAFWFAFVMEDLAVGFHACFDGLTLMPILRSTAVSTRLSLPCYSW